MPQEYNRADFERKCVLCGKDGNVLDRNMLLVQPIAVIAYRGEDFTEVSEMVESRKSFRLNEYAHESCWEGAKSFVNQP